MLLQRVAVKMLARGRIKLHYDHLRTSITRESCAQMPGIPIETFAFFSRWLITHLLQQKVCCAGFEERQALTSRLACCGFSIDKGLKVINETRQKTP